MRLTYVGMMGLVFGLAVYGCGDDGGSSSGNTGGTDTGGSDTGGGDTGGSDTGGGDTGGGDTGGTGGSTGGMGGSMGGMGGMAMGGMGGGSVAYDTLEEACPARCEVLDDLTGADCDDAFVAQFPSGCVDECLDEEWYFPECEAEWLTYVSCETAATQEDFQCNDGKGISVGSGSLCEGAYDDVVACWGF